MSNRVHPTLPYWRHPIDTNYKVKVEQAQALNKRIVAIGLEFSRRVCDQPAYAMGCARKLLAEIGASTGPDRLDGQADKPAQGPNRLR